MKKISHSFLFVLLSAMVSIAFAAKYYPPSEIVETTDPAAAAVVEKQARDIQMKSQKPMKKKAQVKKSKKKPAVQKETVNDDFVED